MNGACGEPDPSLPPSDPGSGGTGGLIFGTGGSLDFGGMPNASAGGAQNPSNPLERRAGTGPGCACRTDSSSNTRGGFALLLGL